MLTHVSLFTGIGGLDLAAEWAGFETILQVEMDDYANKVLEKHWPDVPRIKDIRDVNRESVSEPITVISGGFPCQPFSLAGKRGGRTDDRYLWPSMLRVIRELRPAWIVGENVRGIVTDKIIDSICDDLENEKYTVAPPLVLPAIAFGIPFIGYRTFVVASAAGQLGEKRIWDYKNGEEKIPKEHRRKVQTDGMDPLSRVYGSPHGIPHRVDRLRCLGNAVVPKQAYPIFQAIAEVENHDVA